MPLALTGPVSPAADWSGIRPARRTSCPRCSPLPASKRRPASRAVRSLPLTGGGTDPGRRPEVLVQISEDQVARAVRTDRCEVRRHGAGRGSVARRGGRPLRRDRAVRPGIGPVRTRQPRGPHLTPALVADALREALLTWLERVGEKRRSPRAAPRAPGSAPSNPCHPSSRAGRPPLRPSTRDDAIPTAPDDLHGRGGSGVQPGSPSPGCLSCPQIPEGPSSSPAPLAEPVMNRAGARREPGQGRSAGSGATTCFPLLPAVGGPRMHRLENNRPPGTWVPVSRPETMSWRPVNQSTLGRTWHLRASLQADVRP